MPRSGICPVSLSGMLRKGQLLPSSPGALDSFQTLCAQSFNLPPPWGFLVTIRWTKTVQFRERVVHLPIPLITWSPLCPATAITRALSFTSQASPGSQAFSFLSSPDLHLKIFTYPMFLWKLRFVLRSLGLPTGATDYACHSFRRGGASFAFQAGIPLKLIKILGEWYLDAVLLYLTVPLTIRLQSVNLFAKAIISHHTT